MSNRLSLMSLTCSIFSNRYLALTSERQPWATAVAYIVLGVPWTIMSSTLKGDFPCLAWEFYYCMVLLKSIISPVSVPVSVVPSPLHIIHILLFPSYTLHNIFHTFLVSVVSPCCRFTSEDWRVGTTNERNFNVDSSGIGYFFQYNML